ncbi:uncharacterized protein LOC123684576 [Harmonia axyridis]|uniref:uncharacterized protein LOC123684576 n=1 Tax=Harmonia axyridis TaxID=115357 RepID=UPI001E275E38|nr:uncharacterized protein LOC123684576 [Harmonia axyridis]
MFQKVHTKLKPWMTQGLINSIRHRDRLKERYLKKVTAESWTEYTKYRNFLNSLIKVTKNKFYGDKIKQADNNHRKIWQQINEVTNTALGRVESNKYRVIDERGENINSDGEKAEYFNKFFANVGETMANKINTTNMSEIPLRNSRVRGSLFLYPVQCNELIEIISILKNKAVTGIDGISVEIIKEFHQFFLAPLCHIVNMCFMNGCVPDSVKQSVTVPVFKSGDRRLVTNYRPIYVTRIIDRFSHIHNNPVILIEMRLII